MYPVAHPLTPSDIFFAHIVVTLRGANARYQQVARAMRCSIQPTFRARHRAQKLGLAVDIEKAINCPQRAVSVIPLPLLDTSISHSFRDILTSRSTPHEEDGHAGAMPFSSPNLLPPLAVFTPLSIPSIHLSGGTHSSHDMLSSRFSVSPIQRYTALGSPTDAYVSEPCHKELPIALAADEDESDLYWSPPASLNFSQSTSSSSTTSDDESDESDESDELYIMTVPAKRKLLEEEEYHQCHGPKHQLKRRWAQWHAQRR